MAHFKELQDKYPALSLKECEDYSDLGENSEIISRVNEEHKKAIDEKVARFIPEKNAYLELLTNLNIMFLGKTGSGKSSTGNMIAGKNKFQESCSVSSCTKTISHVECKIGRTTVRMVDTPGFFDTDRTNDEIATEIMKEETLCRGGVHLFVFVKNITACRFDKEEIKAFKVIEEMFGSSALKHTVILFTHVNSIESEGKTIAGYVKQSLMVPIGQNERDTQKAVKEIYQSIGYRVVGVENFPATPYEKEVQRKRLMKYFQNTLENGPQDSFVLNTRNLVAASNYQGESNCSIL